MRHISGYVWVAGCEERQLLFGENTEQAGGPAQNIVANNITPYKKKDSAQKAKKELAQRAFFSSLGLVKLEMRIAETREEFFGMENEKSLVGIVYCDGSQVIIFGPRTREDVVSGVPVGMTIQENGLTAFDNYDDAVYAMSENARKATAAGALAYFLLTFVDKKHTR